MDSLNRINLGYGLLGMIVERPLEVLLDVAGTVFLSSSTGFSFHNAVEYSRSLIGRVDPAFQESQFISELESWSEEGSAFEDREEAMRAIKNSYVNQGKGLNLNNFALTSLPNCIGQLTNLERLNLSENSLATLPNCIGQLTNLQELDLSSNRLEAFPDSIGNLTNLQELDLSSNRLETLPDSIGNLTNLQELDLRENSLATLPESIGNANDLHELDLMDNPLRALPMSVLDLPSACSINLNGSQLSDQVLHRLQEITSAAEYSGPRISFSMGNGELDEVLPSLDELFKRYFDLAGDPPEKFDFVDNLSENQKTQLQSWLSRLSTIGNLRRAGESEKEFAQKVLSFVDRANQDEKFRDVFLGILDGASDTCGDRVALSLLHIGVAYQQATMDLSDPKKVADFLKRGPGALDILEKIARDKVLTLPMVDEIEVYLAYPVQLRETLNLPIDVDKMLYFACSSVTAQDLEGARQEVQSFLDDEEASLKFLIKQNIWVETLQKAYPERYEEINNQRYDMLDDPKTRDQAMGYYEQELIKLSREVLELDKK